MKRRASLTAAALALAAGGCGVMGPTPASTVNSAKVGASVNDGLAAAGRVRVIVSLKEPSVPLTSMAARGDEIAATSEDVLAGLSPSEFRVTRRYEQVSAIAGEVTREGLARLESHPAVRRVDVDEQEQTFLSESVPLIHGDEARSAGYTGSGVVVAVLDTGVDTRHPDLAVSMASERCFCTGCCPNGGSTQSGDGASRDRDGHGTHVSGTIAAPGIAQPVGVAPGSYIAGVKVLNDSGTGMVSDIVAGLDWVLSSTSIKVVNMSIGGGRYGVVCDDVDAGTQAYGQVIAALRARGTLTVVSSGNSGYTDSVGRPACVRAAFAIGAVYDGSGSSGCSQNTPDRVTCYTNSSPLVELWAPGSMITAAGLGGGTNTIEGTSMAAPHVSGAAAVLLQANPSLNADQMISIFKSTGRSVTDTRNGLTLSRLDVMAALRAAR
jgi:subtilisin family serine protease